MPMYILQIKFSIKHFMSVKGNWKVKTFVTMAYALKSLGSSFTRDELKQYWIYNSSAESIEARAPDCMFILAPLPFFFIRIQCTLSTVS